MRFTKMVRKYNWAQMHEWLEFCQSLPHLSFLRQSSILRRAVEQLRVLANDE